MVKQLIETQILAMTFNYVFNNRFDPTKNEKKKLHYSEHSRVDQLIFGYAN
jgi:uncharacterized membrane protein